MPHTPNELIELIREKPISARELTRLIDEGLDPNHMLPITLFSVDSENNNLSTPLLHLITGKDNSVELAEILIAHGADIGKTDLPREQNGSGGVGNTPLLTAIAANDEALAHFLIEQCIKQNRREVLDQADISSYAGNTPLMLALKKGLIGIAYYLIDQGCDVNKGDRNPRYPLDAAIYWDYPELIIHLKLHNAEKTAIYKKDKGYKLAYSDLVLQDDLGCHPLSSEFSFYHTMRDTRARVYRNKNAKNLNITRQELIHFIEEVMDTSDPASLSDLPQNNRFKTLLEQDKLERQEKLFLLKHRPVCTGNALPVTTNETIVATRDNEISVGLISLIQNLIEEAKRIDNSANAHVYDRLIMDSWNRIRTQAISDGMFRGSETKEVLFNLLEFSEDIQQDSSLNHIIHELRNRFVEGEIRDGFEGDYKDNVSGEAWIPVNTLEFWLVLQKYLAYIKKNDDNFPSLNNILIEALDPIARGEEEGRYPSHAGFIANLFYIVLQNHVVFDIKPADKTILPPKQDSLTVVNDNRQMSSTDDLLTTFRTVYKEKLKHDLQGCFGFFRRSRIDVDSSNLQFADVLKHALYEKGHRTRQVLVDLNWIHNNGQINTQIPALVEIMEQINHERGLGLDVTEAGCCGIIG